MPRDPYPAELKAHYHIVRAQYWIQEARSVIEHDARLEGLVEDLFQIDLELERLRERSLGSWEAVRGIPGC